MFDVLCGVLLLCIGYLIGQRRRPSTAEPQLTEEELRAEKKSREQWELLMNFNGKGGVIDE